MGDPSQSYFDVPSQFLNPSSHAYVRVEFHVFRQDDGSGGLSPSQIESCKENLNAAFNPHGIFFLYGCDVDYIDNTYYYINGLKSQPVGDQQQSSYYPNACIIGQVHNRPDALNIYLLRPNIYTGDIRGIAGSIPGNWCIVRDASANGIPNALGPTLPHEVGHCLGLLHTFTGESKNLKMYCQEVTDAYYVCSATPLGVNQTTCAEFVNGTNSETCGDRVSDTPADISNYACNGDYPTTLKNDVSCFDFSCHPIVNSNFVKWIDPNCQLYQPDFGNFMRISGTTECRDHFSSGQASVMFSAMDSHPKLAPLLASEQEYANSMLCPCVGVDVVVTGTQFFQSEQTFSGDLILQPFSQAIVTSTLHFTEGHGIQVKRGARLTVDGGVLTTACDHPWWRGINVEGNASQSQPGVSDPDPFECGIVQMLGNARVEKARCAISTSRYQEFWNQDYYGGLVDCRNTLFLNNRKDVEFMKYRIDGNGVNNSRFVGCEFRDANPDLSTSEGVTIWSTDDIRFENCRFLNKDASGILAYDAYVKVLDNNLFENNKRGISSYATAPMFGTVEVAKSTSTALPNRFVNNFIGIEARGNANVIGGDLEILENEFEGGWWGVNVDGSNTYVIKDNRFMGPVVGVASRAAGDYFQNSIECNHLSGNQVGILFMNNNGRTQFKYNQFAAKYGYPPDVLLGGDSQVPGRINSIQGGDGDPARNCFTFNPEYSGHITTGPDVEAFTYLIRKEEIPSHPCEIPSCNLSDGCSNPNSYFIAKEDPFSPNACLGPQENFHHQDPVTLIWYDSLLVNIRSLLLAAPDDSLLTFQWEVVSDKRLEYRDGLLHYLFNHHREGEAEQILLREEQPWRWLFGLYLRQQRHADASAALDSLDGMDPEDRAFSGLGRILLQRAQQAGCFLPSPQQDSLLQWVAHSSYPERAYARSLLHFIFKTEFDPELPANPRSASAQILPAKLNLVSGFLAYPNPAGDHVTLRRLDESSAFGWYRVLDSTGRMILEGREHSTGTYLETSSWPAGVYWLLVRDEQQAWDRLPILIQH